MGICVSKKNVLCDNKRITGHILETTIITGQYRVTEISQYNWLTMPAPASYHRWQLSIDNIKTNTIQQKEANG